MFTIVVSRNAFVSMLTVWSAIYLVMPFSPIDFLLSLLSASCVHYEPRPFDSTIDF